MVERQLRARGIHDERVLDAMGRVPRELFVAPDWRQYAYDDAALPIGANQTISQPYMVARICAELALRGGETVLDVGTGSGYQAAVLAELADDVHSLERIPELAERALAALESTSMWRTARAGSPSMPRTAGSPLRRRRGTRLLRCSSSSRRVPGS
jgi:protein-L-isoaspartate(D-aspartate) O-methyltransferase